MDILYQFFYWLMTTRLFGHESHSFDYAILACLVVYAVWSRRSIGWSSALKYGFWIAVIVVYVHEMIWFFLYGLMYDPYNYQYYTAVATEAYFGFRVLPTLWHFSWNRKLLIPLIAPIMLYSLFWFAVGLPVTLLFPHGNARLFQNIVGPLYWNIYANMWENGSWMIIIATAVYLIRRDFPFFKLPFAQGQVLKHESE